ncbi:hypothetical protein BCR42DRAFT_400565, partial [Absidia repens]
TLSESSPETTPTLLYLSPYNTLYPLDIEDIYSINYSIQENTNHSHLFDITICLLHLSQ